MDKVQKTAFTGYNAPSSEPFRLHLNISIKIKKPGSQIEKNETINAKGLNLVE
jgi:hypothetical protein